MSKSCSSSSTYSHTHLTTSSSIGQSPSSISSDRGTSTLYHTFFLPIFTPSVLNRKKRAMYQTTESFAKSHHGQKHYRFRRSDLPTSSTTGGEQLKFRKVYAASVESCGYFYVRSNFVAWFTYFYFEASQNSCYLPDADGDYQRSHISSLSECYALNTSPADEPQPQPQP